MKSHTEYLWFNTKKHREFINITDEVEKALDKSQIKEAVQKVFKVKVAGVRAGLVHDHFSARQGVQDDNMNVICMGGRTVGPAVAWDLVQAFLACEFSGAERHVRRLGKIACLEQDLHSQ